MEEASSETNEISQTNESRDPSKTIEDEIQLGDTIIIIGGKYDKTQGKVYFKNDEMIHIMPLGLSNRIIELPSTVEDIEELKLEKGFPHSFVAIQDFRVGQIVEALKEGELVNTFVVNEVNEKEDSVVLVDNNKEEFTIEFNFTGIPLDSAYDVLRGTEAPTEISNQDVEEEI